MASEGFPHVVPPAPTCQTLWFDPKDFGYFVIRSDEQSSIFNGKSSISKACFETNAEIHHLNRICSQPNQYSSPGSSVVNFTAAIKRHCGNSCWWNCVPFVCGGCEAPVEILKAKIARFNTKDYHDLVHHPDQEIQDLAKKVLESQEQGHTISAIRLTLDQGQKISALLSLARAHHARCLSTWEPDEVQKLCEWYDFEPSRRCGSCRLEKRFSRASKGTQACRSLSPTGESIEGDESELNFGLKEALMELKAELARSREAGIQAITLIGGARAAEEVFLQESRQEQDLSMARSFAESVPISDLKEALVDLKAELARSRDAGLEAFQEQATLMREARAANGDLLQQLRQEHDSMARSFAEFQDAMGNTQQKSIGRGMGRTPWNCFPCLPLRRHREPYADASETMHVISSAT